jgi:hypothetical protein
MARGYGGDVYPRIEDNARLGIRFQRNVGERTSRRAKAAEFGSTAACYVGESTTNANYFHRVFSRLQHDLQSRTASFNIHRAVAFWMNALQAWASNDWRKRS